MVWGLRLGFGVRVLGFGFRVGFRVSVSHGLDCLRHGLYKNSCATLVVLLTLRTTVV